MRTRTIGKTIVIVMMMVVIAIGGLLTYRVNVFHKAPIYENQTGISTHEGIVTETNFVANERKLLAHKIAGDEPVVTIWREYDARGQKVNSNRVYSYYDDGAVEFDMF